MFRTNRNKQDSANNHSRVYVENKISKKIRGLGDEYNCFIFEGTEKLPYPPPFPAGYSLSAIIKGPHDFCVQKVTTDSGLNAYFWVVDKIEHNTISWTEVGEDFKTLISDTEYVLSFVGEEPQWMRPHSHRSKISRRTSQARTEAAEIFDEY